MSEELEHDGNGMERSKAKRQSMSRDLAGDSLCVYDTASQKRKENTQVKDKVKRKEKQQNGQTQPSPREMYVHGRMKRIQTCAQNSSMYNKKNADEGML